MSNEVCLCALFTVTVMESYSNVVRGFEWSENEVLFFFFLGKEGPSPRPSSCFIRLHFRNFKLLSKFSFIIHWSWVSVLKLRRRGRNKPWKRFVPARQSNSNLRTFKDVHIHLMHTYHGIKQQQCFPPLTVNWKTGNDCLWKSHCFSKAFAAKQHAVFHTAWN